MSADIIDFAEARVLRIRRLTVAANVEQKPADAFFELAELRTARTMASSELSSALYVKPELFDQIFVDEGIETFPEGARLSFLHARASKIGGENAARAVMAIINIFIHRRRSNNLPITFAPSLQPAQTKRAPFARVTR